MPEKHIKQDRLLVPVFLFLFTIATRIPFTSKFLYHYDSCQFALALKKYDIALHQPHPPGYFLYVMLGRLLNCVTNDANSAFVSISVLFGALTVVAIYYLGKELYQGNTALLAAALAITSPNLWFHGEVALTYTLEAFFSTLTAIFCWNICRGKHNQLWFAAATLAIAGGIRQNTPAFLFPLWLYAMKDVPLRKIIASLIIFCLLSLSWFIPMIWMTGGWDRYQNAFRELWLFNTGHNSVFERGWPAFRLNFPTLLNFVIYGVGAGVPILGLAAYSLRKKEISTSLGKMRAVFFSLWILPSVSFYLLVFIHPGNPGYSLIFLPALLILTAASAELLAARIKRATNRDLRIPLACGLLISNTIFFLFFQHPVSLQAIRNQNRNLSLLHERLKVFDPSKTAIFTIPYVNYGFRHVMYYLPEYTVYLIDVRTARTGERRKTFWGRHGETLLTDGIPLPPNITSFAAILGDDEARLLYGIKELKVTEVAPSIYIASGSIKLLQEVYPEVRLAAPQHVKHESRESGDFPFLPEKTLGGI